MNKVEGTTLKGQGINGTLMGRATQTTTSTVYGKALKLGGNQYVNFGNKRCLSQIMLCSDSLTIAMFIYHQGEITETAYVLVIIMTWLFP